MTGKFGIQINPDLILKLTEPEYDEKRKGKSALVGKPQAPPPSPGLTQRPGSAPSPSPGLAQRPRSAPSPSPGLTPVPGFVPPPSPGLGQIPLPGSAPPSGASTKPAPCPPKEKTQATAPGTAQGKAQATAPGQAQGKPQATPPIQDKKKAPATSAGQAPPPAPVTQKAQVPEKSAGQAPAQAPTKSLAPLRNPLVPPISGLRVPEPVQAPVPQAPVPQAPVPQAPAPEAKPDSKSWRREDPALEPLRDLAAEYDRVIETLQKQEQKERLEVHKRADELHKQHPVPVPKPFPCLNEQKVCISCLSENKDNPLKCNDIVKAYSVCAGRARQSL